MSVPEAAWLVRHRHASRSAWRVAIRADRRLSTPFGLPLSARPPRIARASRGHRTHRIKRTSASYSSPKQSVQCRRPHNPAKAAVAALLVDTPLCARSHPLTRAPVYLHLSCAYVSVLTPTQACARGCLSRARAPLFVCNVYFRLAGCGRSALEPVLPDLSARGFTQAAVPSGSRQGWVTLPLHALRRACATRATGARTLAPAAAMGLVRQLLGALPLTAGCRA